MVIVKNEILPKEGFRFELYGNQYEITAVIDNKVRFSAINGGKIYKVSLDEFIERIEKNEIQYIEMPNYPLLNPENYQVIFRKKRYIEAVLQLEYFSSHNAVKSIIEEVAPSINDPVPPSSRTVIRWVNKFIHEENFLNEFRLNNGNRSLRFPSDVEAIIDYGLHEIYLKPRERRTAKDVQAYIVSQILELGIQSKPPSLRTIQRRIKALDKYDIVRRKKGIRTANQQFKAAGKKQNSPFLMSKVEIDSHIVDVIVLDDHTFEIIGRPTLTCAIDVFSKCIVGWNLSMLPPNIDNTISLLKDMFTRPTRNLPGGIPSSLIPDNGVEFKNNTLSRICENRRITIIPSQKRTPNNKPYIENFFRNFALNFSHTLEGTTFSNPSARGEYNSKKHSSLTFSNLKFFINKWIEDIYHQSKHKGLDNRIPIVFWNEISKAFPVLYMHPKEADVLARTPYKRTINNGRIEFACLQYYSHDLANDDFENKSVEILVDRTNLEKIYIKNPKDRNSYIFADSTNSAYTKNLSLKEHIEVQKIKKELSEKDQRQLGEYTDLYARFKLYNNIQDKYAENKAHKKLKLDLPKKIEAVLFNTNSAHPIHVEVSNSHATSNKNETTQEQIQDLHSYDQFSDTQSQLNNDENDDYESMSL